MNVGVVTFPGSNCDRDAMRAIDATAGLTAVPVWHADHAQVDIDAIVLPGGFSWGDYLRPGAIAARATVMDLVADMAADGKPVIGICNGFQVLCEAGLLPGALQRNTGRRFVCTTVSLTVGATDTPMTHGFRRGQRIALPIAHADGRYDAAPATIDELEHAGRVVLRYVNNPNGSTNDIAAISNEAGNVVGMMPHPERAISTLLGGSDGATMFSALATALTHQHQFNGTAATTTTPGEHQTTSSPPPPTTTGATAGVT